MNNHECARQLRELAAFIDALEQFELPQYFESVKLDLYYFGNKEPFLKAAHTVGSGEKDWNDKNYFIFRRKLPSRAELTLSVHRDAVCRKVQEEKWECEPLLSQSELASIGGAQ